MFIMIIIMCVLLALCSFDTSTEAAPAVLSLLLYRASDLKDKGGKQLAGLEDLNMLDLYDYT